MRVDTSHRNDLTRYDRATYNQLADRCVSELRQIRHVRSIVVNGSLAKDDLVPGWSDLDIIVFLASKQTNPDVLEAIKHAIRTARGELLIGIGIDIAYEDQFRSSHKLCGRPYMMTYEVANYGQLRHGKDLFAGILYDAQAKARVDQERPHLIASEVHNWRRAYVSQESSGQPVLHWIFTCAKALLRILQCETGPNLTKPIGCRVSLEKFVKTYPTHPATVAFSAAVQIRENWAAVLERPGAIRELVAKLEPLLNSYPLRLPQVQS